MTPLFIPLRSEYFEAFARGEKTVEYRRYGARWNESTCVPGRAVILSHGYSGCGRLNARVIRMRRVSARRVPAAQAIYPPETELAAIELEVLLGQ